MVQNGLEARAHVNVCTSGSNINKYYIAAGEDCLVSHPRLPQGCIPHRKLAFCLSSPWPLYALLLAYSWRTPFSRLAHAPARLRLHPAQMAFPLLQFYQ